MIYCRLFSYLLVVLGAFLLLGTSLIIHIIMTLGIQLKKNSQLAEMWSVNPMPLYLEFYAFNWTNSEDLYTPGVKPKFEQIGPITFLETKTKVNVTWNDNGTVSYRQYHTYVYDKKRSAVDLYTPITTLNPVLAGLAHTANVKNWGFFLRKGLQMAINQLDQSLVITRPFIQSLFKGYPDDLVSLSSSLPISLIPKLPMHDKFAWFHERNASSHLEGDFNMGTRFDNLGVLEEWNHSNRTKHYKGTCGSLQGTSAAELFPPYPSPESLSIFVPDMCRTVALDFEKEEEVGGILGRKYVAGVRFLDNGTLYPENKCFCPGVCLPSGAANISSCKYDGPVYITLPHFNLADQFYMNGVEGMKPDTSQHKLYYIIEPLTGIILQAALRLQLNLYLAPAADIRMFETIPEVMFPVLWFQEVIKMPDIIFTLLKIFLYLPLILRILGGILLCIGLFLNRRGIKSLLKMTKKDNTSYCLTQELKMSDIQKNKAKEANEGMILQSKASK